MRVPYNTFKKESWAMRTTPHNEDESNHTRPIAYKLLAGFRLLLKELRYIGIPSHEYLYYGSLFVTSVSVVYTVAKFKKLLLIMLDYYPNFYQTKLFMLLIAIRRTCTLEGALPLPGLESIPKGIIPVIVEQNELDHYTLNCLNQIAISFGNEIKKMEYNSDDFDSMDQDLTDLFIKIMHKVIK